MDQKFIAGLESLFIEGFKEDTIELFDHSWRIRTLNEEQSVWKDKHIQLSFQTSFLSAARVPTLSIAIKEIDGRQITDIFGDVYTDADSLPEDMLTDGFARTLEGVSAENLRQFLLKQPSQVIDSLFLAYKKLEDSVSDVFLGVTKEDDFFRGAEAEASEVANEATDDEEDESSANGSESKKAI